MLSIQECGDVLKDYKSTDEEIENVRDELQLLVELVYDNWTLDRKQKKEQESKV
jgi:hypothetical protein